MSRLTFINEKGFPHSACRVENTWYGFKPKIPKTPYLSKGYVDNSDRTSEMLFYVTLNVDDADAADAVKQTVAKYQDKWYSLGVCDCVSFTADLARACKLVVPPPPNLLPESLLINLFALNPGQSLDSKLPKAK